MNLLRLFQDQIGNTLVNQASSFLGEDKTRITSAMTAILPSLVGSMISKGSSKEGAADLMEILTSGGHDGSLLDNVAGLFDSTDSTDKLKSSGDSILSKLIGDKLEKIISSISNFSGISEDSSSSLIKMAAPLIMSIVGKQVAGKGLNAAGLTKLLSSQKKHVNTDMPPSIPDLGNLLGFPDGFKDDIAEADAKVAEPVNVGTTVPASSTTNTATNTDTKKSIPKWLLPFLLFLLVVAYFGFKAGYASLDNTSTDTNKETTPDATNTDDELTRDANNTIDPADTPENTTNHSLKSVTLPGGKEISFAEESFIDQIVGFLNADEQDLSKGFTFDGLDFANDSAELAENSERQIKNLAAILSLYQDFNIKIEGHTNHSADAKANKTRSENRAKAVKAALVAKGVATARISAVGLSQEKSIKGNGENTNNRLELFFRE